MLLQGVRLLAEFDIPFTGAAVYVAVADPFSKAEALWFPKDGGLDGIPKQCSFYRSCDGSWNGDETTDDGDITFVKNPIS